MVNDIVISLMINVHRNLGTQSFLFHFGSGSGPIKAGVGFERARFLFQIL